MYRIAKTLNHNSFIGVEEENNREYLVMGKGIAFGKKTGQRVQPGEHFFGGAYHRAYHRCDVVVV